MKEKKTTTDPDSIINAIVKTWHERCSLYCTCAKLLLSGNSFNTRKGHLRLCPRPAMYDCWYILTLDSIYL